MSTTIHRSKQGTYHPAPEPKHRESCPTIAGLNLSGADVDCPACDDVGHLDAWMRQTCDMENEGDRLAWEQYQELIKVAERVIKFLNRISENAGDYKLPTMLCRLTEYSSYHSEVIGAALKAAKGE